MIRPIAQRNIEIVEIPSIGDYQSPISFSVKAIDKPESLQSKKNTILLDANLIKFPLQLRKWKEGDWFIPFGMQGKKKVSDFFIDEKFSQFEKENTWLLISDGQITWIVNHRLDDRHKISASTSNYLQIVTY